LTFVEFGLILVLRISNTNRANNHRKKSQIRKHIGYPKDTNGQSVDEIIQPLSEGKVTDKKHSKILKLRLK
jgi:hypothetical protein